MFGETDLVYIKAAVVSEELLDLVVPMNKAICFKMWLGKMDNTDCDDVRCVLVCDIFVCFVLHDQATQNMKPDLINEWMK